MTEPKEEKCEACCGSGYINFWTDDGHISMRTCRRCDGYGYIKVKPKTNEEWFCELPTEEKAHFLSVECARAMCEQQLKITNRNTVDYWKMWLKQPHADKE